MQHPLSFESKWLAISIPPLMAVLFLAAFSGCDTTPMKPGQGGVMAPPKPSMTPPPFPAKPGLTQAKPATSPANGAKPTTPATAPSKIAASPAAPNVSTPSAAGPLPLPKPPGSLPGLPGSEKTPTNPDGTLASPVSKVEQAGNPVTLAADVLASGNNPFLNKLPKPKVAVISAEPGMPEPSGIDPFDGLTLQGILYGKNPLAMVAISGDTGSPTLVRPGDTVGAARIVAIHPDGIEVADFSGHEHKTLGIPSIIGYGGSSTASGTAPASGGSETLTTPEKLAPSPTNQNFSGNAALENIKKITAQNNGKIAKDGTTPQLME